MVITAKNIAKNEGIIKLWSGFAPMLQRHAIYSGCRLLLYEQYRKQMGNDNGKMSLATTCFGKLKNTSDTIVINVIIPTVTS